MRRFIGSRGRNLFILGLVAGTIALFASPSFRRPAPVRPPLTQVKEKIAPSAPPVAEKIPHTSEVNGEKVVDDYFWLRSEEPEKDPKIMAYLKAENAYADAALEHTKPLQKKLYAEFLSRIKQTDLGVPVRLGDYYYYSRTVEKQDYDIHCRKLKSLDAPEEVLLDENELAKGHEFFSLGAFKVSDDHKLLAYSVDLTGNEHYTLRVKDLTTGKLLADEIPDTTDSIVWSADGKFLFYLKPDETERPATLHRHALGAKAEADKLVFTEKDEKFYVSVSRSKSRKYIFLSTDSKTTSEVLFLSAAEPEGEFRVFDPRKDDRLYGVDHYGEKFYVVTNADGAKNFKLMETPVGEPGAAHWKEVIPHRTDVKLDGIELFQDYFVLEERTSGLPTLRVRKVSTGEEYPIEFPEPTYSVETGPNLEFNSHLLRFTYSSLISPSAVYDFDLVTKTRELKKEQPVLGGYDRKQYVTERLFATATDGAKIPISLVYKKGLPKDGTSPCLLYGYGAYGFSEDPYFSSSRLSLLDRGFVYATAHVRGGGECGRYWYEDGKLAKKSNSFTDFIACAEFLVKEKYTSPAKLTMNGASAGGLLMGAVMNLRPDLFHAVVAEVPFVDCLNTMLDESLPLTVTEFDEWGNPQEKEAFGRIRAYSPYNNVRPAEYPNLLIMGSLADTRVAYWEPAKWAARLRATKVDKNLVLLKTNLNAGHGGVSGRYEALEEQALIYAFLLDSVGIRE